MKKLTMRITLRSFLLLVLTFTGSILFAQLTPAYAAQYYVAGDTGLDTNTGTSSQPWKTIQKAATVMVAGDTVNVKGGIEYSDSTCSNAVVCPANSGTSTNPITYKAWEGTGVPIINGLYNRSGFNSSKGFITITNFKIHNTFDGIRVYGNGTRVINNEIIKCDRYGVQLGNTNVLTPSYIFNNTIGHVNGEAINVWSSQGITVKNNILFNSLFGLSSNTNFLILEHDNNHYYGNTGMPNYPEWGSDYLEANGISPAPHDVHADPLFVDPTNGDFRLQTNSPAINAGANVSAYGITTDILGRARPNAGAFDIGAYEDPNIYVAGDVEVSGNGSMGSPFKTIQEAADVTTPGDVVNVKGGIDYTDTNSDSIVVRINFSGNISDSITYKPWNSTGKPIINLQNNTVVGFYIANNRSYVNIVGFLIKNPKPFESWGVWLQQDNIGSVIANNVIDGGLDKFLVGIRVQPTDKADIIVSNNTISDSIIGIDIFAALKGPYYIHNNIITKAQSAIKLRTSTILPIINNNILFNNSLNYEGISESSVNIYSDPFFVDLVGGNFRLQPNSPAINAGLDASAYGVTTDILGVPRPQGSGYDIGAYEYYAVPVSITSPTGEYVTTTSPTISGSATTIPSATITKVQYSLNNGEWIDVSDKTFSFTLNNLSQGSHTVRVRATDSYGNQTHESQYATKTFIVDSIAPTIKLTKLGLISNLPDKSSLTYYFTSQTPKIEGVTEANSTVAFTVGDKTYTTTSDSKGNFVITLNNPKLGRGESVITYSSTDQAGNISETRTLTLNIGEEYFPDWIYGPVVTEGQNIEEVNQNEKQEEIQKETEDKDFTEIETYEILVKDTSGNPIANTKVKIGDKFYTTNEDGFIYVTNLEASNIPYEVNKVTGEFTFNPEKEVNEIVVEIPVEQEEVEKEGEGFNWWWIIIPLIISIIGGTWYSYSRKKS